MQQASTRDDFQSTQLQTQVVTYTEKSQDISEKCLTKLIHYALKQNCREVIKFVLLLQHPMKQLIFFNLKQCVQLGERTHM